MTNLTETLDDFLQSLVVEKGYSPHTVSAYRRDINALNIYLQEQKVELSKGVLHSYMVALMTMDYSTATISRKLGALKSFAKFCLREKYWVEDFTNTLITPKRQKQLPKSLPQSSIEQLLALPDLSNPAGKRDRAILEFLYGAGVRVSELCNLKLEQLYLNEGFVRVYGKGSKERVVPIGFQAIDALNIYIADRIKFKPRTSHMLLNQRGTGLSRSGIFRIIRKYTSMAGLSSSISPHTFRHSYATHLLEGGASIRVVQELLGHRDISTTEIYTHVERKKLRDAYRKAHPRN